LPPCPLDPPPFRRCAGFQKLSNLSHPFKFYLFAGHRLPPVKTMNFSSGGIPKSTHRSKSARRNTRLPPNLKLGGNFPAFKRLYKLRLGRFNKVIV
jgi:hypothetical protein